MAVTVAYTLSVSGKTTEDTTATKTFSNVDSDVTIAMGTNFAAKYLALTTLTGKSITINDKTTADLNGS